MFLQLNMCLKIAANMSDGRLEKVLNIAQLRYSGCPKEVSCFIM